MPGYSQEKQLPHNLARLHICIFKQRSTYIRHRGMSTSTDTFFNQIQILTTEESLRNITRGLQSQDYVH